MMSEPYRNAFDRLLLKDKTCPARAYLIANRKALKLMLLLCRNAVSNNEAVK